MRCLPRSLLEPISEIYEMLVNECLHYMYQIIVKSRACWQLVVLCPRSNVVVWFCSLHKKVDVHIKAINKLSLVL